MKSLSILALAISPLLLTAAPALSSANSAGGPTFGLMGVRAAYEDLAGNHPHTNTTCYLVNRSFTSPITIQALSVLGPGGRLELLGSHPTIQGTVIEPLAELRVEIDNSIPGVIPQTTPDATGVRNVIVRWAGPEDALNLTSTILRIPNGDQDQRDQLVEQGYEITP